MSIQAVECISQKYIWKYHTFNNVIHWGGGVLLNVVLQKKKLWEVYRRTIGQTDSQEKFDWKIYNWPNCTCFVQQHLFNSIEWKKKCASSQTKRPPITWQWCTKWMTRYSLYIQNNLISGITRTKTPCK